MNLFDCAIKKEEEAKSFYEKLAASTSGPELKNLFSLLAAAEGEHHEALLALRDGIGTRKTDFTVLNESACLFKPLRSEGGRRVRPDDDTDAYGLVVREEEEEIRFYEELAAKAPDEGTRNVLLGLADEERKHLSIVENIYDYVETPKNYLAWGEFSNLREY